ncbi:MAG: 4-hydroxy-tetrahydrodipicolinate reductase [Chloroflexi bacterium]|nr:4-hydroxy-tetrahydrodipicolinate reductase [Chloroflexota bacterium]
MASIRVIVHGATGRMGKETLAALGRDKETSPVGGVGRSAVGDALPLPAGAFVPYDTSLERLLSRCQADVVVDFTNAQACIAAARVSAARGLHFVTGTSGLSSTDLDTLRDLSRRHTIGIIVGPSFAIGAIILNHLARIAAPFFEYVDIFEAHHEAKIDAPSGTALALARAMATERAFKRPAPEREPLSGTRGGDLSGVSIHSTRMPGRLAAHEVVFGMAGQTLSLKHDTLTRECFMPGVLMAVKEVVKRRDCVIGLESLLGLK